MDVLNVFDPSGATEITQLHAPRLASLAGKRVALLSNDMWQAHRMLPMLADRLRERHGVEILAETEFPMGNGPIDREETADRVVARGADAVIIGNAA